jgi:putative ATP-dependent endonuclease of the OLD family
LRIKRARIQNFRCLEDVEVIFDSVTTFIGPNGVGKSTVLRALEWFFNGGILTDDDVLHGAAGSRIRVEVEFNALTSLDREVLGKYAQGSHDTVTIWRSWSDGEDKMTGKAVAFAPFEEIRALGRAADKKSRYNELRGAHPELELPAWTSQAAAEGAMSDWEREHPERLEESEVSATHFFGFAGTAVMSGLFDYVLVTADLRASEEALDAKSTVLGRIIERAVERASADAKLQGLSSQFLLQQAAIHDEHFKPQLEELSRELSEAVTTFTHGRSVKISPVNTESKPQRVQFSLSIRDHAMETPIDRQGHGFQRALLIAALKLLADRGAAAEQQGVICLAIEEPELFQHPVQARAFASVLRKLAENDRQRFQVTYATHSPFFIEASHFPQVRRVSRSNGNDSQAPTVDIAQVTLDQVINRLDGFVSPDTVRKRMDAVCLQKLPEALFAETVVLVEGTTDQGVIEGHAEREGIVLASEGTLVVEGGGKDSILLPHAILSMLGIPCYLVFDGDHGCAPAENANQSKHNRSILRYLGVAEEDWPSSGAYDRYAVFEDCLETEIREKWPAWEVRRGELVNYGIGFPRKHGATYRRAALEAADKAPDLFLEMLSSVRGMRGRI